jgi:hypothetical protein
LSRLHAGLRAPWTENDYKHFRSLLDKEINDPDSLVEPLFVGATRKSNPNTVLEILSTLALGKALFDLEWSIKPADYWSHRNLIQLERNGVTATIRKGFSKDVADGTVPYLKAVGHAARGKQPDIVLSFSSRNGSNTIFFIGDAKRNISDGEDFSYCRTAFFAMLADMTAFSQFLGINLATENGFLPDGWNNKPPKGLLFFSKMRTSRAAGNEIISGFSFEEYADVFNPREGDQRDCQTKRFRNTVESIVNSALAEL